MQDHSVLNDVHSVTMWDILCVADVNQTQCFLGFIEERLATHSLKWAEKTKIALQTHTLQGPHECIYIYIYLICANPEVH